ncbi:MAG TPA: VWA domain-containing protein [Guyparkeria sp.]|nr:VWA domain-containing protein [Guyparkeria sp.]
MSQRDLHYPPTTSGHPQRAATSLRRTSTLGGCLLALLLAITITGISGARAASDPELHVLIDVSGSMKRTDPENLRVPALRLLGDLIPEQGRIRVDLFGDRITPILPAATATPETKKAVREAAERIRSNEPFTDIPAALEAADSDWGENTHRHIILLSDGKVDISPDEVVNERATQRLREQVIPALIDSAVRVHTIGLSAEADDAILTELAEHTGGLALSAASNADLQRVFLSLFETTAPRTGLPLVENRFRVDASISELILLIFRKDGAEPTRIKLPDGNEIDTEMATALQNWRWDDSAGRDLITIERPPAGSWQIQAAEDPENRALVITDLKLDMPDLPSRLYPGEVVDSRLQLISHDEPLVDPRLTNDIDATLLIKGPPDQAAEEIALNDLGTDPDLLAGDGTYDFQVQLSGEPGVYTFEGQAKGPTFERVIRKKVALTSRAAIETHIDLGSIADDGSGMPFEPTRLVVEQDLSVLKPEDSFLKATIHCGTSDKQILDVALLAASNRFDLPTHADQDCQLSGTIKGQTRAGRALNLPLELAIPRIAPATAVSPALSKSPLAKDTEPAQTTAIDNPWYAVQVGAGGLLLLVLLGWLWQKSYQRRQRRLIAATKFEMKR